MARECHVLRCESANRGLSAKANHSTGTHGEPLIILEGKGAMTFPDSATRDVNPEQILKLPAAD